MLARERKATFGKAPFKVVPHIINTIKDWMKKCSQESNADIMMIEVGGTVGTSSEPFLEAIRQYAANWESEAIYHVHLHYCRISSIKELKNKTNASCRCANYAIGLQPDMILARADYKIPKELLDKISKFCDVPREAVIPAPTVSSIYDVRSTISITISDCHWQEAGTWRTETTGYEGVGRGNEAS